MTIDGVKVKKIKVLQDGQEYQCKKGLLTSGEIVFSGDFVVSFSVYDGQYQYYPNPNTYWGTKVEVYVNPDDLINTDTIQIEVISNEEFNFKYEGEITKLKPKLVFNFESGLDSFGSEVYSATFKSITATFNTKSFSKTNKRNYADVPTVEDEEHLQLWYSDSIIVER